MASEEWEEVTLMMEIPDSGQIGSMRPGESYFQILGLSSEKPLVKVNNQLYNGQFVDTLGSQLFVELENKTGESSTAQTASKVSEDVIITDKVLKLEPVFLEPKKDKDSSEVESLKSSDSSLPSSSKT